jgi:hypothetical protein
MLKFRCQHCGQRIAVPARHLGKLVTCAECGRQTHPLAREIVEARDAAAPDSPSMVAPVVAEAPRAGAGTSCANCGIAVGKLQSAHQWEGERVCGACYHVLSAESSLGGRRAAPVVAKRVRAPGRSEEASFTSPPPAVAPGLREQVVRGLMVFVVGVVALYGALTLLRDLAGLIAVTAVTVLAVLGLYAVFRSRWTGRLRQTPPDADAGLLTVRR